MLVKFKSLGFPKWTLLPVLIIFGWLLLGVPNTASAAMIVEPQCSGSTLARIHVNWYDNWQSSQRDGVYITQWIVERYTKTGPSGGYSWTLGPNSSALIDERKGEDFANSWGSYTYKLRAYRGSQLEDRYRSEEH